MKTNNYTVLYAEDEKEIRSLYVSILENYFGTVYEASNGVEAIAIYEEHTPNLVLLDINMPILSGLEVAQKIRQTNKECKIVVLSALCDTSTLIKACELYLVKYLIKPIKTLELDTLLNRILEEFDTITKANQTPLVLDFAKNVAIENSVTISLSRKEILLLQLLAKNIGEPLSHFEIIDTLWYNDFDTEYDPNKLRVLVYRLNKKFQKEIVFSVYNEGYFLSKEIDFLLQSQLQK